MSLVSWLPLNGNLTDYVNGDIFSNASSAVFDSSNGWGKVLSSTATNTFAYSADAKKRILGGTEFSISFFIYVPYGTSGSKIIFGCDSTDTYPSKVRKYSIFQYPTPNDLHLSWQKDDLSTAISPVLTGVLVASDWTHVAITYDGSTVKVYINGALKGSYSISGYSVSDPENTTLELFQYSIRNLADLRIYNNCLSAKEVRELSYGLICKWSANSVNTLVYPSTSTFLRLNSASSLSVDGDGLYTITNPYGSSVSTDWGAGPCVQNIPVPYGYTYRISMDVFTSDSYGNVVDINNYGSSTNWGGNDNDNTSSRVYSISLTKGKWSHVYWGSTNNNSSNTNQETIYVYDMFAFKTASATASITYYIKNIKFELSKKTFAEGFSPIVQDDVIYDESGRSNNGTKHGNIQCYDDGSLSSFKFDGSSSQYLVCESFPINAYYVTYSCWINHTVSSTWDHIIGQGRDYGTGCGLTVCVDSEDKLRCHIGNGSSDIWLVSTSTVGTGWHMVTCTYANGPVKLYLDGELIISNTLTGPITYGDVGNHALVVGKMAHSYTSDSVYFPFHGCIADARVYARALNADDVKYLYQVTKSITRQGELIVHQLSENDSNSITITRHGIEKSTTFNEIMTLDDGSMWLQLSHQDLLNSNTELNKFPSISNCRSSCVFVNDNCWSQYPRIKTCDHGSAYEFLVMHQEQSGTFIKCRWIQTVSPYDATFATTGHSNITVVENINASWGGMFPGTYNNAWFFNNNIEGNWFGSCLGQGVSHNNGIPSYNGTVVLGAQDVYIRVYSATYSEQKSGMILTKEINIK